MKKYVIVIGDTNDGDYIIEKNPITDKQISQLKTIISKLTGGYNNWDTRWEYADNNQLATQVYKDVLSKEDFQLMQQIIPYGEYGIHTIESIEILVVTEEIKLL